MTGWSWEPISPIELVGERGVTLEQVWHGEPRAYRTVALPGFPNFFMLMGPHSPFGNQSLVIVAETQADYIVQWLRLLRDGDVAAVSPREEATERFNEEMREALPSTITLPDIMFSATPTPELPRIRTVARLFMPAQ